jgi:hypothetical protein
MNLRANCPLAEIDLGLGERVFLCAALSLEELEFPDVRTLAGLAEF